MGNYTLKVFSEQYNGDYQTDYASAFVDIPITVIDTTPPFLSGGTATRESVATATVTFTSDEAGTYYYAVVDSGADAPSDLTASGTSGDCAEGENTISLTNLSAGKKDIYIAARDAAGNVSDPIKIGIPISTLPTPQDIHWDSTIPGKATWNAVAGATGYTVQLYKDGSEHGEAISVTGREYTFDNITEAGSYTFAVQATDGETYKASAWSEQSAALAYYAVTFDTNGADGGSPIGVQVVANGGKATEPTSPTKTDYTFMGWYSDSGFADSDKWDFSDDTVSGAMTLYAKWLSTNAGVTAVSVDSVDGTISGTTITVELPHNTTPPTDSGKISITVPDGATKTTPTTSDNGATWMFTVTAEDGSTKETYTINVSVNSTHTYGNWRSNEQTHWKECACGDKTDVAAHSATDDGDCTTAVTCADCGYVTKAAETSHSFTSYVSNNDATCTEDGTETATCAHDGCNVTDTRTDSDSKTGHTYGESWKSDADNHWHECSCGAETAKAPHDFGPWVETKPATETEAGSKEQSCQTCGYTVTEEISRLDPVPSDPDDPDEPTEPDDPDDPDDPTDPDEPTDPEQPEEGDREVVPMKDFYVNGTIPEALEANGFTVETIKQTLVEQLGSGADESAGNVAFYDVRLIIWDGSGWQEATEDDFPVEGGLLVTLRYPEQLEASWTEYDFTVAHMLAAGDKAGTVEIVENVQKTAEGLQFTVNSLSPFAVSWTETKVEPAQPAEVSSGDTEALIGAAVVIGGGAALLAYQYREALPIWKLGGVVTLADEAATPVADAAVTLYQNGEAVKTLTTDADGSFAARLPKGTYEAVVTWERDGVVYTSHKELTAESVWKDAVAVQKIVLTEQTGE